MTTYTWRTREDGVVLVVMAPGAAEVPPVLAQALVEGTPRVRGFEPCRRRWEPLCNRIEARFGLPHGWLLVTVWRESGGDEHAFRREPNGWTGIGLTQPTSPHVKRGFTDQELWDPEKNLSCGARYLAEQITRYGRNAPKVFAAYNAGSVVHSDRNPWGMVQTDGHVSAEISALNWYLLDEQHQAAELAAAHRFTELELLPDLGRVTLPDEEEVKGP